MNLLLMVLRVYLLYEAVRGPRPGKIPTTCNLIPRRSLRLHHRMPNIPDYLGLSRIRSKSKQLAKLH